VARLNGISTYFMKKEERSREETPAFAVDTRSGGGRGCGRGFARGRGSRGRGRGRVQYHRGPIPTSTLSNQIIKEMIIKIIEILTVMIPITAEDVVTTKEEVAEHVATIVMV
jgi:hypothetical protein